MTEQYYQVKVFDVESNSTTTVSRTGTVEQIKESVERDGWVFVAVIGPERN